MPYPLLSPYKYWVGEWLWAANALPGEGAWVAPHAQAVSVLDFAGLPAFVSGANRGVGIFATPDTVTLGAEYDLLGTGDCRDLSATTAMRNTLKARLGITGAIAGAKLADLFFDCLLNGDPEFLDRTKPLVPNSQGVLEMHLGGHSLVRSERFVWGTHRHTNRLKATVRKAFQRAFDASQRGNFGPEKNHHLRYLDALCAKYGVDDWKEFVPPGLVRDIPGRLPHKTTVSETFNTANSSTLGPVASWTEMNNSFASGLEGFSIVSNKCRILRDSTWHNARCDTPVSSDDHSATIELSTAIVAAEHARVGVRIAGSYTCDDSYYSVAIGSTFAGSTPFRVYKLVNGLPTELGNYGTTPTTSIKSYANGSTIKGYSNGTERVSVTDTAVDSNLYGWIGGYSSNSDTTEIDNFTLTDLIPATPTSPAATPNSTSQITTSWTDNSDNETGFEVDVSTDGGSNFSLLATTAANATSYAHTGLSPGTTRHYRVRAVNSTESTASSYTSTVNATTLTAQEIAVFDGETEITDGQAEAIDFGSAIVGAAALSKTFTIQNTGETALVVSEITLPEGYTFADGSWVDGTIDPESSQDFTVEVVTDTAGTFAGEIEISSNDASEATFNWPVTAVVRATRDPHLWQHGFLSPPAD